MGAGGNSGDLNFPEHMLKMHRRWMYGDYDMDPSSASYQAVMHVAQAMDDASTEFGAHPGRSPYYKANEVHAYDPDSELKKMDDTLATYSDIVASLQVSRRPQDWIHSAAGSIDADIFPTTYVSNLVDSFENRTYLRFARTMSRMSAGLFDVRSVQTSNFQMAWALSESEREKEVTEYELQLQQRVLELRANLTSSLAAIYMQQCTITLESNKAAMAAQVEISKLRIAAKQDEININVDFEVKDALWDLELFNYPAKWMAAISGAATIPTPTKAERYFTAAMTGMNAVGQAASIPMNFMSTGLGAVSLFM